MIQKRIEDIETTLADARNIPERTRAELEQLVAELKSEVGTLAKEREEEAQRIAGHAHASAHEATREDQEPHLVDAAIEGLKESVEGFETSHPRLTETVNRLATALSNMGI